MRWSPGISSTARGGQPLAATGGGEAPDRDLARAGEVGIRLPPHVEPGLLVESWEKARQCFELA